MLSGSLPELTFEGYLKENQRSPQATDAYLKSILVLSWRLASLEDALESCFCHVEASHEHSRQGNGLYALDAESVPSVQRNCNCVYGEYDYVSVNVALLWARSV